MRDGEDARRYQARDERRAARDAELAAKRVHGPGCDCRCPHIDDLPEPEQGGF